MLFQEIYRGRPWHMMVCCILINQTTRAQLEKVRGKLFERYPTPLDLSMVDEKELSELIKPCGLHNKRAKTLKRFSDEWCSFDRNTDIREYYGIGEYAEDSYKIFVEEDIDPYVWYENGEQVVHVKDKELRKYLKENYVTA